MKYFGIYNSDRDKIVVDDTYVNLEVVGEFKLKELEKNLAFPALYESDRDRYKEFINYGSYILYGKLDGDEYRQLIYGIGLNATQDFSCHVDLCSGVSFYTQKSDMGVYGVVPVFAPELEDILTVYVIAIPTRKPQKHGFGLEVYNAQGETVFNSNKQHINVIACGSDEKKTIKIQDKTAIFQLGKDYFQAVCRWHHLPPAGAEHQRVISITVQNGMATIAPFDIHAVYNEPGIVWGPNGYYIPSSRPTPEAESYKFFNNFGWLVANIV